MNTSRPTAPELFQPGLQSAFNAQGPHADTVATLALVMTIGATVIFVIVLALTAYAIWGPPQRRRWSSTERFVVGAGLIVPVVVLAALLTYSLSLLRVVGAAPLPGDLVIEIVAEQWWWRVHYLDQQGEVEFATANEVHVPVGRPVEFILKAHDVIHSFWVPSLAGKADMIPGRVQRLRVTADRRGVFRGQCAEYCGGPHAQMALYVVAATEQEFAAWRSRQRQIAVAAEGALAQARSLFESRCGVCHTVRGTSARGTLGPDLTHVGSRLSLAAGMLPNNVGNLNAWIAGSQQIKPGNLMPSMHVIGASEVRAVADYLAALD
jgi:cytochrome c oxidase subunit 2